MLYPHAAMDSEAIMDLPTGKPIKVAFSQGRNPKSLRLYWALLRLVCDNMDQDIAPAALHKWVKIRLGYSVLIPAKSGSVVVDGSVAFDKMDEGEFRTFLTKTIDLIRTEIIPGINKASLEAEALAMIGEPA